jgi:hypothetical protein
VREREQASRVEIAVYPVDGSEARVLPPDSHEQVLMVAITNGSNRPIRNIAARAVERGNQPADQVAPERYGSFVSYGLGPNFGEGTTRAEHIIWLDHGPVLPLLTAGDKGAFVWSLGSDWRPAPACRSPVHR